MDRVFTSKLILRLLPWLFFVRFLRPWFRSNDSGTVLFSKEVYSLSFSEKVKTEEDDWAFFHFLPLLQGVVFLFSIWFCSEDCLVLLNCHRTPSMMIPSLMVLYLVCRWCIHPPFPPRLWLCIYYTIHWLGRLFPRCCTQACLVY